MPFWRKVSGRKRIALGLVASVGVAGGVAVLLVLLVRGGSASAPLPSDSPSPANTVTPTSPATSTATPSATAVRNAAPIDGVLMNEEEWQARKNLLPLAVMIDNSPSAMPHSGLDRADLVFEAFVEGTITRFMAVFWRQEASFVEPVRSARTPFVIWAGELDALYAYAGGANTDNEANAVGQIAEWGIKGLSAFGSGAEAAYHRDSSRYAPYNLVLDTAKLREIASTMGIAGPAKVEPWLFKDGGEVVPDLPAAAGIEVNFRDYRVPWQLVQWHWDAASGSYLRFQSGGPHVDARSGQQLRFKNIVVMRVNWEVVDESGHVLLGQVGEGPATVFLDGKAIEGKWKKADRTARTRFYTAGGREIAFNRGPIFIEVVGPDSLVTVAPVVKDLPPIPPYEPPPHYVPEPEAGPEETGTATPPASPTSTPGASPSPSASPSPGATAEGSPSPAPTGTAVPPQASPSPPSATSSPAATATAN
ncbi:MAG: DUF3048 domain-containing protein [Dehalococcoidia bacterium]|nr:DUF3048 domain-containing protein [Chloroflexi bacterium CFX7]MCK6563457.1 DUF3048 domain-containing protein [Dehalococcoidia bacterium]NUQ54814.1 DUF3048 domain-containing protein [Dehalococcoidia bacterium]RIL04099.1 MAG: hypothetical protein DCC78_00475 [bacterium]